MNKWLIVFALVVSLVGGSYAGETPRLGLREMMPHLANPNVIYNEMIHLVDALLFPMLAAYPADASPMANAPAAGSLYIVPTNSQGDWSGHENDLAVFLNDEWTFIEPKRGYFVYRPIESYLALLKQSRIVFTGSVWVEFNRQHLQNLYLGGDNFTPYAVLSMDYDASLPYSSFGPVHIKEATTDTVLFSLDPLAKRLTSGWAIHTASEYRIGNDRGFSGIVESASRLVVSGGIIVGVTD